MFVVFERNLILGIIFSILCTSAEAAQTCDPATTVRNPISGREMMETFSDEFTSELDRHVWSPGLGSAGSANASELQWYLPEQVTTDGQGLLLLTANRRTFNGRSIVSGAINSAEGFSQLFGRFEIKAKLPKGPGTWPAFWLLPIDNSWPPEIDVVEQLGKKPSVYYGSYHSLVGDKKFGLTFEGALVPDASDTFHTYAVDWRPDKLIFSVDNKVTGTGIQNIPQKPMYMLINLAFGGAWAGPISDSTPFPSVMQVDYVKVYGYCDLLNAAAPRFLQFGKTFVLGNTFKPGGSVQISGTMAAGLDNVQSVNISAYLQSYDGKRTFAKGNTKIANLQAMQSAPFDILVSIPSSIETGYYNIKIEAFTPGSFFDPVTRKQKNSVYRGSAAVLKIGPE